MFELHRHLKLLVAVTDHRDRLARLNLDADHVVTVAFKHMQALAFKIGERPDAFQNGREAASFDLNDLHVLVILDFNFDANRFHIDLRPKPAMFVLAT